MRFLAVVALFVLALSCQHYHTYSIEQRESVSVGMTEQQVRDIMGEPATVEEASAEKRVLVYKGDAAEAGMFNEPRDPYEFLVTIENGEVVDVREQVPEIGTRR